MDNKNSISSIYLHINISPLENGENGNELNLFPENYEIVASQNVVDEGNRLYIYHLERQMENIGLRSPFPRGFATVPQNASSLQTLALRFASSPQRRWVYEQAQNVDLYSLNVHTFYQLLCGLFQEGGVTWERVLVLFYFCTDLSIRAIQERIVDCFFRIYDWTRNYITHQLSVWIEDEGGWVRYIAAYIQCISLVYASNIADGVVLRTSMGYAQELSIIGVCCIGVLIICLYMRNR